MILMSFDLKELRNHYILYYIVVIMPNFDDKLLLFAIYYAHHCNLKKFNLMMTFISYVQCKFQTKQIRQSMWTFRTNRQKITGQ